MDKNQIYTDGFQSGRDWWARAKPAQRDRLGKAMRTASYEVTNLIDPREPDCPSDQIAFAILRKGDRNRESGRSFWHDVACENDADNLKNLEWPGEFVDGALGMFRPD